MVRVRVSDKDKDGTKRLEYDKVRVQNVCKAINVSTL